MTSTGTMTVTIMTVAITMVIRLDEGRGGDGTAWGPTQTVGPNHRVWSPSIE
jgi:hypothetical protein